MEIPLPPLAEQQRLVARLEELSVGISEARAIRTQATEQAGRLLYAGLRDMRQQLVSSSVSRETLGSLTTVTSGGTPSRANSAYWGGEIPWVKTGELVDGDISGSEEHITEEGLASCSAKIFPPGTGRLLIPAATNQACCAVLPNPKRFDPRYIQFWLKSLYVELREDAQGGAQPNWNGGMIKKLPISLPTLAHQRRVVSEQDALRTEVEKLNRAQAEAAAGLDAVLPAILDRAFRGEL